MHQSAHDHMALCIETYMPNNRHYRVLDLGARLSPGQKLTHRQLLKNHDIEYNGIDVQQGNNVDMVMEKPYWLPAPSNSVDVLISGQVFEHIPFFWATMLEIARVLKPNGYAFITAPSRGHEHSTYDCWRYYPDGYRAMATWSRLKLVEAHTDFPAKLRHQYDYGTVPQNSHEGYWGDSVGVFQKPAHYPRARAAVVRAVTRWWGNLTPDLEGTPRPKVSDARRGVVPIAEREQV